MTLKTIFSDIPRSFTRRLCSGVEKLHIYISQVVPKPCIHHGNLKNYVSTSFRHNIKKELVLRANFAISIPIPATMSYILSKRFDRQPLIWALSSLGTRTRTDSWGTCTNGPLHACFVYQVSLWWILTGLRYVKECSSVGKKKLTYTYGNVSNTCIAIVKREGVLLFLVLFSKKKKKQPKKPILRWHIFMWLP